MEDKIKPNVLNLSENPRHKLYYFNICNRVHEFLSLDEVQKHLVFEKKEYGDVDSEHYSTFIDSERYKKLTTTSKNVIFFSIFSDEYSPLSRSSVCSKSVLTGYFSIINIDQKLQAKLPLKILFFSVGSDVAKEFPDGTYNFVKDQIKSLEMTRLKINGNEFTFKCFCYQADNLELNFLYGLGRTFHGKLTQPCRFCLANCENMNNIFFESDCTMRTENVSSYLSDILPMNDVKYLDFCHDYFLGTVRYALESFFCRIIHHIKITDLNSINRIIRKIYYGNYDAPNSISSIGSSSTSKSNIAQQSQQMRTLLLFFPLIIFLVRIDRTHLIKSDFEDEVLDSDAFNESNETVESMKNIMLEYEILRRIGSIQEKDIVFDEDLSELRKFVSIHLCHMKNFYGKIRPKQHNLLHVDSVIRNLGSIEKYSTIRFEALHKSTKRDVIVGHNMSNIAFSIASKQGIRFGISKSLSFLLKEPEDEKYTFGDFVVVRFLNMTKNMPRKKNKSLNLKIVKIIKVDLKNNKFLVQIMRHLFSVGSLYFTENSERIENVKETWIDKDKIYSHSPEHNFKLFGFTVFVLNQKIILHEDDILPHTMQLKKKIERNFFYNFDINTL